MAGDVTGAVGTIPTHNLGQGSKSRDLERVEKAGWEQYCFLCPNLESHAVSFLSHFLAQGRYKTTWFQEEEMDASLNVELDRHIKKTVGMASMLLC